MPVCTSDCLCVRLSVCLTACVSDCLNVCLSVCVCLIVCMFACLYACLSVCLPVCMSDCTRASVCGFPHFLCHVRCGHYTVCRCPLVNAITSMAIIDVSRLPRFLASSTDAVIWPL